MEKLVYLLWKHESDSDEDFREKLLGNTSRQIIAAGAHHLRVSVVDGEVAPAAALRTVCTKPAITGLVSIWTDTATRRKPYEKAIEESVARMSGYLVTECVPLVNTTQVVPDGQRTPGWCQVVVFTRPPRLSYDQWLEFWLGGHTKVALETQPIFGYRRNVVARRLTYAAPAYDAVVEENFPSGAMNDPAVFFDSVGDPAKQKRNAQAQYEDSAKFIDFDKFDRLAMSEYVMKS